MKFTKIPVTVDAVQWFKNGDHPLDYSKDHQGLDGDEIRTFTAAERKLREWEGDIVRYFRRPDVSGAERCKHCAKTMDEHGWIDTPEGDHIVCPGDWIITGIAGEHYPCKPDLFKRYYKPADKVDIVPEITMQQMIDVGFNAFGLQLFVESIAGKTDAKTFDPFSFKYKGVKVTLQPDGEVDTRHQ